MAFCVLEALIVVVYFQRRQATGTTPQQPPSARCHYPQRPETLRDGLAAKLDFISTQVQIA
ncbi:hypothetical protein CCM_07636 [Cordyceps militaris CM01]|uniref:Uncharacterized protein n=1 Tax=Cordyceps militaris (strain CM01) TaxID=983644 RepID=G3JQD4_CORMM|nr:uncharacterized protein CCM_07636 [Cordyceps militaris CM01]EGX89385.1 hypothetical protein CCM_07636 [Cordyceps militaris CM01]